jgi:hypothetical protein
MINFSETDFFHDQLMITESLIEPVRPRRTPAEKECTGE